MKKIIFLFIILKLPLFLWSQSHIVRFQYWYDDNINAIIAKEVSSRVSCDTSLMLDVSSLSDGMHNLSFRFEDNNTLWSPVIRQAFFKTHSFSGTGTSIVDYQYWFDNNTANLKNVPVPSQTGYDLIYPIDLKTFFQGIHNINIRFKDNNNLWSPVIRQAFFNTGYRFDTTNQIILYRYWFDDAINSKHVTIIDNPMNTSNLDTKIDTGSLGFGKHVIHFQFEDKNNLWSYTTLDTFIIKNYNGIIKFNKMNPDNNFFIYPNPTTNLLSVSLNGQIDCTYKVEIISIMGNILQTFYKSSSNKQFNLDLNGYPKGLYLIKIETNDKFYQSKVIKE